MLRECGLGPRQGTFTSSALTNKQVYASKFRHKRTFRGHTCPVYCVAVDQNDRYVITCSDDCLVKIWCMATGVLLMTCRGHETEVSDVKVSADGQYLATGCNAGIIRVWSLDHSTLGHPVAVLQSSEKPVTFLDWNAAAPSVLASTSTDGACRVWDALTGLDPVTLRPSATFGHLSGASQLSTRALAAAAGVDAATGMPLASTPGVAAPAGAADPARAAAAAANEVELITCHWTPCGEYLVAGGNNAIVYLWYWGLRGKLAVLSVAPSEPSSSASLAMTSNSVFARKDWPVLHEHCCLRGHRNTVSCVKFSNSGAQLATSSHDGTFRVFWPPKKDSQTRSSASRRRAAPRRPPTNLSESDLQRPWLETHTVSCAPLPRSAAASHRRRQITVPKVLQVEWSSDDRYIIAVLDDNSVRVFEMTPREGVLPRQVHVLTQHTRNVYEVAIHPIVPTIFASWSYDGTVILWDLITGVALKTFSMRDTYPGHGQWAADEPISLLGATWNKAGTALFAVDCSGQWHTFGLGSADIMSRAMYDQFWKNDYGELARDQRGGMLDVASGQPPHVNPVKRVIDFFLHPYDDPYSEHAAKNGLSRVMPAKNWKKGSAPRSVVSATPLMSAVEWHVRNHGRNRGDIAVQSALEQCSLSQDRLMEQVLRGQIAIPDDESPSLKWTPRPRYTNPVQLTGSVPQPGAQVATPAPRAPPARAGGMASVRSLPQGRRSGQHRTYAVADSSEDDEPIISDDDNADANYEHSDDDPDLNLAAGAGRRHTRTTAVASGVRPGPGLGRSTGTRATRYYSEEEMSISDGSESEEESWSSDEGSRQRSRSRRAGRRAASHGRTTGRARQPSQRAIESATMNVVEPTRQSTRQSTRRAATGGRSMYVDDFDEDALEYNDNDMYTPRRGGEQRRSRQANARADRYERRRDRPAPERHSSRVRPRKRHRSTTAHEQLTHRSATAAAERPDECYSWLLAHDLNADIYHPQVGDEVVYIRDLHEECLRNANDVVSLIGPRQIPSSDRDRNGSFFRKFEPCRVSAVDYIISNDGARRTLARVTLVLAEPVAPELANRPFLVDVPPPLTGHKEFIILRRQFERAVTAPGFAVTSRVKCSYIDEVDHRRTWYHGTLTLDKLEGCAVALEDVWDKPEILNRYRVRWDATGGSPVAGDGADNGDDVEDSSPWELHAPSVTSEMLADECKVPHERVTAVKQQLKTACCEIFSCRDVPELPFKMQPACDERIEYTSRKKRHYTAIVPLPICVHLIMSRLDVDFYRSFEQLLLDIALLESNAELFYTPSCNGGAIGCAIKRFLYAVAHGTSDPTLAAFKAVLNSEDSEGVEDDELGLSDHNTRRASRAQSRIGSDDDAPGPSRAVRRTRRPEQIIENDTDISDDEDDNRLMPPHSPMPAPSRDAEAENDGLQSQAAGAARGADFSAYTALFDSPIKRGQRTGRLRNSDTGRRWLAAFQRLDNDSGSAELRNHSSGALDAAPLTPAAAPPSNGAAAPSAAGAATPADAAAPPTRIRLKRRLDDSTVPPELSTPAARHAPTPSPMESSEADDSQAYGAARKRAPKRARTDSGLAERGEASSRATVRARRTRNAPEQDNRERRSTRHTASQQDYTGMYEEDLYLDTEELHAMTVAELKNACHRLDVEFDRRADKQTLITLLVSRQDA